MMSKKSQKRHELKFQARQQLASKFDRTTYLKFAGIKVHFTDNKGLETLVNKVVK